MKIPKKVKIGGFIYKIIRKKEFAGSDAGFSGTAKHNQTEIELSRSHKGELYNAQKIEECFMHEIVHCVDVVYNGQKFDEDTVDRLSQGLYQVLKDNKLNFGG